MNYSGIEHLYLCFPGFTLCWCDRRDTAASLVLVVLSLLRPDGAEVVSLERRSRPCSIAGPQCHRVGASQPPFNTGIALRLLPWSSGFFSSEGCCFVLVLEEVPAFQLSWWFFQTTQAPAASLCCVSFIQDSPVAPGPLSTAIKAVTRPKPGRTHTIFY